MTKKKILREIKDLLSEFRDENGVLNPKIKYLITPKGKKILKLLSSSEVSGLSWDEREELLGCSRKTIEAAMRFHGDLKFDTSVPMKTTVRKARRYLITAAQNATPIFPPFWNSLMHCQKYYGAEFYVVPGRYKNPTSIWTANNRENEWWASEVLPYLFAGRQSLNESIMILGDIKVEWASGSPLNGFDTLSEDKSGIVGHGNRALRSIPRPHHKHPKIMMTTGACTVPNYTDTRRGKIAEFNHSYGALIVEIHDDKTYFVREINALNDGSFIDLDKEFTPSGVRDAKPALSLTMGDTHHRFIAQHVQEATFDAKDSMVNVLKPQHLIWHDLLDFYSRNHHHKGNWLTQYGKWKERMESVKDEVDEALAFVKAKTRAGCHSIIVSANHDRALERWMQEVDFRGDPVNIEFYLRIALEMVLSVRRGEGGITYADPFITYGRSIVDDTIRFLSQDESFVLMGVEYGLHGDQGPNGARGTTRNLSNIGVKVTKGHDHTAGIINGCYSGGKSTGRMGYEKGGPSSHSNAHVVQYANGKRSILFIVNGRYCLPRPKR